MACEERRPEKPQTKTRRDPVPKQKKDVPSLRERGPFSVAQGDLKTVRVGEADPI